MASAVFSRATSMPCFTASGWIAARSGSCPLAMPLGELPDGAMLQEGTESYLIVQGRALKWSPAGYRAAADAIWGPMLLTPPSTLRALAAGYVPVLHPSAAELMAATSTPSS